MKARMDALQRIAPSRPIWPGTSIYLPPIYAFLDDSEFELLMDWFAATERECFIGECGITAISMLQGLLMGNFVTRMVQAGHYSGYSSLLLGMMFRKMGAKNALISFDIDQVTTSFAQHWIEKADLTDYVKLVVADSADPIDKNLAWIYLGGAPQVVFIDSSHQYRHTLEELNLWAPFVEANGFLCLHDVTENAQHLDATGRGGVARAVYEWLYKNKSEHILIEGGSRYVDPYGFGLIQAPNNRSVQPLEPADEADRRIIRDSGFNLTDAWYGDGWVIGGGRAKKSAGSGDPLCCFAPIKVGEVYEFQIDIAEIKSGHLIVDVGAKSGKHPPIATAGSSVVRAESGNQNSLICLVPSSDFAGTVTRASARQI
jgi:predicted O-methyltransferase YrrM